MDTKGKYCWNICICSWKTFLTVLPSLQLIHQNRQAILNQFAASSPVGINMRAGMQQQMTPQVRGMQRGGKGSSVPSAHSLGMGTSPTMQRSGSRCAFVILFPPPLLHPLHLGKAQRPHYRLETNVPRSLIEKDLWKIDAIL